MVTETGGSAGIMVFQQYSAWGDLIKIGLPILGTIVATVFAYLQTIKTKVIDHEYEKNKLLNEQDRLLIKEIFELDFELERMIEKLIKLGVSYKKIKSLKHIEKYVKFITIQ